MADQLKYGRVEWERRFLLHETPDLSTADAVIEIEDHYLPHTRLRLRKAVCDGEATYKLARKLPPVGAGAVMGNLYITEYEYSQLRHLRSRILTKSRYKFGIWSIDVFAGELDGLILAEAEAEDEEGLSELVPPFPFVAEVTEHAFFRGGVLSHADAASVRAALRGVEQP